MDTEDAVALEPTPTLIRTFLDAEARLAEALPGYESRAPQQRLAAAVEQALEDQRHLLGQAGTGTGKSLGYLIPAILSGQRVIISTATKALQNQVAEKDIPFLEENLGVPFTWALLKGRNNYFCRAAARNASPGDVPNLSQIMNASEAPGFTGERDSFPFEISGREWNHVCADTDGCSTYGCRDNPDDCWAEQARRKARASQLVVVNHALFLTDLTVGPGRMLGGYDAVVFDEAHELEQYATNAFGTVVRETAIVTLCTEVINFAHRDVFEHEDELGKMVDGIRVAMADLWETLVPGRIRIRELTEHADQWVGMVNALHPLVESLASSSLTDEVGYSELDGVKKRQDRLFKRAGSLHSRLTKIVTESMDDMVRWVEEETLSRGDKIKVLKACPINVAPIMRDLLFGGVEDALRPTAILVSATLSPFGYIAGRLGVDEYTSLDVGSPFDFPTQGRIYIPTDIPEPTPANRQAWSTVMAGRVRQLLTASEGRALVLFTSYAEMTKCYDAVSDLVPFECRRQGAETNRRLAEWFKVTTSGCLFATRSFMTGVDFQGETCSLVIVDKLPFPVPTEPVTEARIESIKRAGGNDFTEYTIPVMSLTLQQAVGRLIRSRSDLGVVAILDPRLKTKGYGRSIMRTLPPFTPVGSVAEVGEFLVRDTF